MKYILFIFIIIINSCSIDFSKESIEKKIIYGVVEKKYFDDWNHGEPTIICKNEKGNFKYQLYDWDIKKELWEFIQIGDSIIKPSGTLILRVKKANGEIRDFEYNR